MKEQYRNLNIIGADETGVGDYLSPLVAAAVFVPKENARLLESWGVQDSKKLSDKQIVELAQKIKPKVLFRVKHLTQSGYNKLNSSFNANELKMLLHMGAINALEDYADNIDLIIIDAFSTKASIDKYQSRLDKSTFDVKSFKHKAIYVTKGESEHVSVAAASIIARARFVELMKAQDKEWNMHFPLGTNTIVEDFAMKFVSKYGKENLQKVAKISFKTTEKLFGKE